MVDTARTEAHIAAYDLFEAVQAAEHEAAAATVPALLAAAEERGWADVATVVAAARLVHRLSHPDRYPEDPELVRALVARAEQLHAPALLALALGLRALSSAIRGDTGALLADACRAIALLEDDDEPPLDRCAAYVVVGASLNSLRLWELVDEVYSAAAALAPRCPAAPMATALLINRVITRVEWSMALLEAGHDEEAAARLAEAAATVPEALAGDLPPLWRLDVAALRDVVEVLRDVAPLAPLIEALGEHRTLLLAAKDVEALPLVDAAMALGCWRKGRHDEAREAARRLAPTGSSSSGARSFPLWVRALVLAGEHPDEAVLAGRDHAALVGQLRWRNRQAVLAAARAQVEVERRNAELAGLAHQVRTDSLTGLGNRSVFESWLEGRGHSWQGDTAVLLLDVDGFKAVNDTFGHDVGDAVLRQVGAVLLAHVRPGDLAVRIGGDEFVVLLGDAHLSDEVVRQRAASIRQALAAHPWHHLAAGLTVTVAVGLSVGTLEPERGVTPAALYRLADEALYVGKRDGSGLRLAVGRPSPQK